MNYFILNIFLVINLLLIKNISTEELGKNKGAYIKTPNTDSLQFRLGNSAEDFEQHPSMYIILPDLCEIAGHNGQRKNFSEKYFEMYNISCEIDFCEKNKKLGLLDVVGYLTNPTEKHSSNAKDPDNYKPANLYEPIWLNYDNNIINPNNYWANFTYNIVNTYKDYIKIWEIWKTPDYIKNIENIKNWTSYPPNSSDLLYWHGTVFEYIRLIRISYEVIKKIAPESLISTGKLMNPEFLDAIMRYTDNPNNGIITKEYDAYGGAYFDCITFAYDLKNSVVDFETKKTYENFGSDSLALKVLIAKKNYNYITKKYGFGEKYPEKIFINSLFELYSRKEEQY
jgi:hypothetical protein